VSAPPKKRPVLICEGKRRYSCELTARAAAMISITEHGNVSRLYVYRCDVCGGWHLTKHPNGRKYMVTANNPIHERRRA